MSDIVVFDEGRFAREVHQLSEDFVADASDWDLAGFVDDHDGSIEGFKGVAQTPARRWIVRHLLGLGADLRRLAHRLAWIDNRVALDLGLLVHANDLPTIKNIFGGRGISPQAHGTMPGLLGDECPS